MNEDIKPPPDLSSKFVAQMSELGVGLTAHCGFVWLWISFHFTLGFSFSKETVSVPRGPCLNSLISRKSWALASREHLASPGIATDTFPFGGSHTHCTRPASSHLLWEALRCVESWTGGSDRQMSGSFAS